MLDASDFISKPDVVHRANRTLSLFCSGFSLRRYPPWRTCHAELTTCLKDHVGCSVWGSFRTTTINGQRRVTMQLPSSMLALAQLVLSAADLLVHTHPGSTSPSTPSPSTSYIPQWSGDLPPYPRDSGALVSACTFAVGPPGPPASALCPAFTAFCTRFRDDLRSRHIHQLKTAPWSLSKGSTRANDDDGDPLKHVKFRTGCTGGATDASDGTFLSAYTATCIVNGVDWVPYVFDQFLRAEFSDKGHEDEPLPIYSSFVGCQVPARP